MHKSAMLRYFETREEIFLRLTAEDWQEWSAALRAKLERGRGSAETVAAAFSTTLAARGMFCDLLAQAPLNLERNVSLEAVRAFKLVAHHEVDAIVEVMQRLLPGFTERDCIDVIGTATSLSGAFWQMANPPAEVAALYRSDTADVPRGLRDRTARAQSAHRDAGGNDALALSVLGDELTLSRSIRRLSGKRGRDVAWIGAARHAHDERGGDDQTTQHDQESVVQRGRGVAQFG